MSGAHLKSEVPGTNLRNTRHVASLAVGGTFGHRDGADMFRLCGVFDMSAQRVRELPWGGEDGDARMVC